MWRNHSNFLLRVLRPFWWEAKSKQRPLTSRVFSQRLFKSAPETSATRARLGHHVIQLLVLHFPLVHNQHAHGHVFVRHTGRRRDVPYTQVVDDRLDDGMIWRVVAIVEQPRAVALAEPRVVHWRGNEVVTPAELVEGQAERVELTAVLGRAGFAFVVGEVRDDGGGRGQGGKRGGDRGSGSVFQSIHERIFGLWTSRVFGAAMASQRMPPAYLLRDLFPFSPQQLPHPVLHLPFFLQV